MKLRILLAAVVLTLVVPGVVLARDLRPQGAVEALGVSGPEVAYVVERPKHCFRVYLWNTDTRGNRFMAKTCLLDVPSGGEGVTAISSAQGRVLWLQWAAGNIREWLVWTKAPGKPKRMLAFDSEPEGEYDRPPIVLGTPWEGSLSYAVRKKVVVLNPGGSRRFQLSVPSDVLGLFAYDSGFAAVLVDGRVVTVKNDGTGRKDYTEFAPGEIHAALALKNGVMLFRAGSLEIHRGADVRTIALPGGAEFAGIGTGIVALKVETSLRILRLSSGKHGIFTTPAPRLAWLGRKGIAFTNRGKIVFNGTGVVGSAVPAG